MKKIIVNNWKEIKIFSIQVSKFEDHKKAFKYAVDNYKQYGYNIAYYSKDLKLLFVSKLY
jgi:hypothetical protein